MRSLVCRSRGIFSNVIRKSPTLLYDGMPVKPSDGLSISKMTSKFWSSPNKDPDGPPQSVFIEKAPSDSFVSNTYDFDSDRELRGSYTDLSGRLRIDALLEDMDALAGKIAYLHAEEGDSTTRGQVMVTASIDTIEVRRSNLLTLDNKLIICGQPVSVGRSSMEIKIELFSISPEGQQRRVLDSYFTMVALDSATQRPTKINPLVPRTPEEQRRFEDSKRRRASKLSGETDCSTEIRPLNAEESALIHSFLGHGSRHAVASFNLHTDDTCRSYAHKGGHIHDDSVPMSVAGRPGAQVGVRGTRTTRLSSINLCNPQMRNMHGNIFGGFLLRKAYEAAWSTAHMYLRLPPTLVEMSRVSFHRPVMVGSILNCDTLVTVVRRVGSSWYVVVQAEMSVLSPLDGSARPTNSFTFIFKVAVDIDVPSVFPTTYDEALAHVEGTRSLQRMLQGKAADIPV